MKLKEIATKAGSISDYFGYIILLFGWYLVNNMYETLLPESSGEVLGQVLSVGLRLLVGPAVLAIVYGGIHERQETQEIFGGNGFLNHFISRLWRFIVANTLYLVSFFVVSFLVLLIAGVKSEDVNGNTIFVGLVSACFSMINLLWLAGIVVERKIFGGLAHAIKLFLNNPMALAIAVIWAALSTADAILFDLKSEQVPLAINIARSGVFAVARVLAVMYVLAIHKSIWGISPILQEGDRAQGGLPAAKPGEKLARASLGFTFVSFVPLLHLPALILGLMAIKRSQRFPWKAAVACWVGGFFTIMYAFLLAGFIAGKSSNFHMPGYAFLVDGNTDLAPYVTLLDQEEVEEVQAKLGDVAADDTGRHWAFDTALALAKYNDHNLDGALDNFYTALQKNPEQGEFYFYYGMALLENDKKDMAVEQFKLALEHEPNLKIAETYIALIRNVYQPDRISSAVTYLLILFILFSMHEYGHAYTAWKLGDDTAKNLGRVTLNPIAHLDLFGSIILPAILLLQQSDFFFGWAKPVPVDRRNFKNPRRDDMIVSFAGPAVNLMVSMATVIVLGLVVVFVRVLWPETISLNLADPSSPISMAGLPAAKLILVIISFLKQLFYTSLILGIFNLIPIPPLDGSWILESILPERLHGIFELVRRFGFMIFILLTMTPVFDYLLGIPIAVVWLGLKGFLSILGFA